MGNALVRKIQKDHNIPEHLAREIAQRSLEQARDMKRQSDKVDAARELTFRQWLDTEKTDETLRWDYHYVGLICEYLQAVVDGDIRQLAINVPPGVGKSFMVSIRFPVYWMERNPRHRIILGAYIRELAVDFSMKALGIYKARNPDSVNKESQDEWTNVYGGSFLPVGVGSGVTGRRAECFPAGTLIKTDGGDVSIGRIVDNPASFKVMAIDPFAGGIEPKRVLSARESRSDSLIRIETRTRNALTCTPDHPIFVVGYGFKPAQELRRGDKLLSYPPFPSDIVRNVFPQTYGNLPVYNLQVEDHENYFANGVLVHNCMLVDDPVKNIAEAMSKSYMDRLWNWWQWDMRTRRLNMDLTPTVVIQTRWAINDLVGRLQSSAYAKDWVILSVPALCETQSERDIRNEELGLPVNQPDLLGRRLGESILPDRMPEESLLKVKDEDIVSFMSLYQQRPLQLALSSFHTEKLFYVDEVPRRAHRVLYWDRAASQGKGDFTVGLLMAMDGDGLFYIEDIIRGQWDDLVVQQKMREAAEIYAAQYGGYRENTVEDEKELDALIQDLLAETVEERHGEGEKATRGHGDTGIVDNPDLSSELSLPVSHRPTVSPYPTGFERADQSKLYEALERLRERYSGITPQRQAPPQAEASAQATEDPIDYICQFWFEQEPGSAGKATALHTLRTTLVGFEAYADKPTENKAVRARPFVTTVNAGNVGLLRAPWNQAYVNELRLYVMGLKNQRDDQVDASSGAFNKLAVERRRLTMS